jgi:hypothetical protein
MTFLLRSALCLAVVFWWMPEERGKIGRTLSQAKTSLAAHQDSATRIGCGESALTCGAALLAGSQADLAGGERTPPLDRPAKDAKVLSKAKAVAKNSTAQTAPLSNNSLTAADMAPPWRGRKPHSGV